MAYYIITTTGLLSPVPLGDIGLDPVVHPFTLDLLANGHTIEEINVSDDLLAAITNGWVTIDYNGFTINSGNIANVELFQLLDDLANVNVSSHVSGETLVYNGTQWVTGAVARTGFEIGDTFSGIPLNKTVTVDPPLSNEDYVIVLTSTMNRNFYVDSNYTSGEFKIISSSNRPMSSLDKVFWEAKSTS